MRVYINGKIWYNMYRCITVDAKIDWRIMAKFENIVTSVDYEEQQAIFLAIELCNVLITILEQEGWNPTQEQLSVLEKAIIEYVLSFRKVIIDYVGEWNVVLGNYTLKRFYEKKKGKRIKGNKTKRQIDKSKRTLYKKLREIEVMDLFKKAPVFSIIITSYIREQEKVNKKAELTRTNTIKYSYGYGSDLKKVFVEVTSF